MLISLFASADDASPKPWETTWSGFVDEIKAHGHKVVDLPTGLDDKATKAAKLQQPMFSPAEFRERGRRTKQDTVVVHFGVLDLDHLTPDALGDFLIRARGLGTEVLLYTAWSHSLGPEPNVSVRALVPFSRPVAASEWRGVWPRFNAYLGGYGDPQCKDEDRAYFLPSTIRAREQWAEILFYPGLPLDVDTVLRTEITPAQLVASRSTVKVTRDELENFQKTLQRKNRETALALRRVLDGEPWAELGNRDNVLYKLCGDLAKAFPTADPASLAEHFRTAASHTNEPDLGRIIDKITRRQAEAIEVQERKERESIQARRLAIAAAFRAPDGRDTPYTPGELETFAAWTHVEAETFRKRWIIQRGGSMYFFVGYPTPRYVGPWSKDDGKLAAHTYLAPATSVGVRLEELTITGEFLTRSAQDLAMDHGTAAESSIVDLTAQTTYFDGRTATIVEGPCPLRKLVPTYHAGVHQWLRLLAGPEYPYLETWLSWITSLERPAVAVYLEGAPSVGKSLLAKGLSRLWTLNGPTEAKQLLGDFNSAMANCPLVFADEVIPRDFRGRGRTGEIREAIQAERRPYKRKHLPDSTLIGSIRLLIAANNKGLLEGEDNLTANDVEAIVGRILHIDATTNRKAAEFLATQRTWAEGWVDNDIIARHALWLVENVAREENPPRFLVHSPASKLHHALTTNTVMGSAVAHWLMSFLLSPGKLRDGSPAGTSAHLVRMSDGILHVNPRAITEHWDTFPTNLPKERATAKAVSGAVRSMSTQGPEGRVSLLVAGFSYYNRPKFYTVRTEALCEWASSTGFASSEEVLAAMASLGEKDTAAAVALSLTGYGTSHTVSPWPR